MNSAVKKYRVDLNKLMQVYAANYLMFCRMFPTDMEVGERITMRPNRHTEPHAMAALELSCKEQTRYTSLFSIRQHFRHNLPGISEPHMEVRLYHDAALAEVCSSQQISRLKPRYDYPNHHMYQQNEKQQVNLFLYDWLHFCLVHRVAVDASTE
ncbi:DUF1249 domain-containing protein [Celerinatantimonas sp. YJH-8]|uniref:DUF1249 domain-containing protein n=1 Tax=Celerinatantimonas sp. YJH-8 TaxID=3228714 RepID=UPI0038C14892